jgi:hypothetical protein
MHHQYIFCLSFIRTDVFRSSHSTIIRALDIKKYNRLQYNASVQGTTLQCVMQL